jgi:hypothetical protein
MKGHHHIQSQESKIRQILSCQRLSLQVSVDKTETSQPEDSRSKSREIWDCKSLLISYDDKFNRSPTAYQYADLATNFIRKFTQEAS